VVVVTLAEDMPVNETLELLSSLDGELRLPVERIVVNSMLPPLFSPSERAELIKPRTLDPQNEGHAALAVGARRSFRETVQAQSLARLAEGAESLDALRDLARRL
jgi:hypothetical protein